MDSDNGLPHWKNSMNLITAQIDISYRSSYIAPSEPLSTGTILIICMIIFFNFLLYVVIAYIVNFSLNKIMERKHTPLIHTLSALMPFLFFFIISIKNGTIGMNMNRLNIVNILILVIPTICTFILLRSTGKRSG